MVLSESGVSAGHFGPTWSAWGGRRYRQNLPHNRHKRKKSCKPHNRYSLTRKASDNSRRTVSARPQDSPVSSGGTASRNFGFLRIDRNPVAGSVTSQGRTDADSAVDDSGRRRTYAAGQPIAQLGATTRAGRSLWLWGSRIFSRCLCATASICRIFGRPECILSCRRSGELSAVAADEPVLPRQCRTGFDI